MRKCKKHVIIAACAVAILLTLYLVYLLIFRTGTIGEVYNEFFAEKIDSISVLEHSHEEEQMIHYQLREGCLEEALEYLVSLQLRPAVWKKNDEGMYGSRQITLNITENALVILVMDDRTVEISMDKPLGSAMHRQLFREFVYQIESPIDMSRFLSFFEKES